MALLSEPGEKVLGAEEPPRDGALGQATVAQIMRLAGQVLPPANLPLQPFAGVLQGAGLAVAIAFNIFREKKLTA